MVELVALALAETTHRLWHHALPARAAVLSLWVVYGVGLPQGVTWAEQVLPEEVNLALPFVAVALSGVVAVRHWLHRHHHQHPAPQLVSSPEE